MFIRMSSSLPRGGHMATLTQLDNIDTQKVSTYRMRRFKHSLKKYFMSGFYSLFSIIMRNFIQDEAN